MPNLDEYLTVTEAARYVGCSVNTLRNWHASGKLVVHRHPLNNYRLFKISELDRLLKRVEKSIHEPTSKKRKRAK